MKTFFIFVSPQGSDPEVSEQLEKFYYSLLYNKSQAWNIEFIFLPKIFKEIGSDVFYDAFPFCRGCSIDEIYEKLIKAFSKVVSIESPGILVIKEGVPPVFEPLNTRNLYKTILFLPNNYGILKWNADSSYYGGGANDREWYKFRKHTAPSDEEPRDIMEANQKTKKQIDILRNTIVNNVPQDTLMILKDLYPLVAPYVDSFTDLGEVLEIEDKLSNIRYTYKGCVFDFSDYDKSISLSPEHATLFLFFLQHKEGVNTYALKSYKNEIYQLYRKFTFFYKPRVYNTNFNEFKLEDDDFVNNLISDVDTNRSNYLSRFKISLTEKLTGIPKKTIKQYTILNYHDDEMATCR